MSKQDTEVKEVFKALIFSKDTAQLLIDGSTNKPVIHYEKLTSFVLKVYNFVSILATTNFAKINCCG